METPNRISIFPRALNTSLSYFPLTFILSPWRLCHNSGNGEKCHAELVSASNGINNLQDPETSSG